MKKFMNALMLLAFVAEINAEPTTTTTPAEASDSSVAISDFVGNWTHEDLNEKKESPYHSYPVSCQEITDHETSDTKLLCTAFPEGIPSYSLPEFSLFGGNLTFHEHSEMFGNL